MSEPRILISVPIRFHGREAARELLEQAGCQVIAATGRMHDGDYARTALASVDALMAGMEPITEETLAEATRLRVVARFGVGYDAIDLAACSARGIVVTNTPGALSDAVAEETLGLMLALTRHITAGDRSVKSGGYDVPLGEDLAAMTLGVIGGGHIGREVISRALAFKMRVLVCDPCIQSADAEALRARLVDLDALLAAADIVTLHVPLIEETRGMVDDRFLARMKKGAWLINTSRGKVVDEAALLAALRSGHLAGAGLDVQAEEPAVGLSRELLELETVVGMPHAGSKTASTRQRMSLWAAQSIIDVVQGRVPRHVVNRDVLAGLSLREG